jgi:hypothetical protein
MITDKTKKSNPHLDGNQRSQAGYRALHHGAISAGKIIKTVPTIMQQKTYVR